ncbi:MAG: PilT/PilU family type 4a pilus ATPase [Alphaproteobacteria bacterium]|nr:PilT/PilU family type 4a pilus ATPase [Alphaproteobacteria bacterium]MCK5554951.1 PilT/PilU family type 4a pilus ATPase [Alphaproteobacteria bacterium]
MVRKEATDLYLTVGVPPTIRVDDRLQALSDVVMQTEDMQTLLGEILTSRQRLEFDTNMELNLALDMGKEGRFRINIMRQRQRPAMVIRRIISKIPSFEDLCLPKLMESLAIEKRGLVLLCGVTSSGKTTTLASLVDYRNRTMGGHIVTIEDPIEFHHEHKLGIVTQREVGIDTVSYAVALKNALRQKPDVILVGEIRDSTVMEQTIVAAETGHLCLATLHSNNAAQTVERIINFFPEKQQQQQIRIALALNLRAIIIQRLIRTIKGDMVVALEIMLNEGLIKELILKGDTSKINDVMANNNPVGMIVFDQSILNLYKKGIVSEQIAIAEANLPTDMKMKIQQVKMGDNVRGMTDIDTSRLSL